eukprot:9168769-Heterocapsa_arctica.AAC.1
MERRPGAGRYERPHFLGEGYSHGKEEARALRVWQRLVAHMGSAGCGLWVGQLTYAGAFSDALRGSGER